MASRTALTVVLAANCPPVSTDAARMLQRRVAVTESTVALLVPYVIRLQPFVSLHLFGKLLPPGNANQLCLFQLFNSVIKKSFEK